MPPVDALPFLALDTAYGLLLWVWIDQLGLKECEKHPMFRHVIAAFLLVFVITVIKSCGLWME